LSKLKGVSATEVGYTGGFAKNPSYEQVCSGNTGHAEAVKVTFDTTKISYKDIIKEFLASNLAGYSGAAGQYRSGIFYERDSEIADIKTAVAEFEKASGKAVRLRIEPANTFWKAEDYHQKYYVKHSLGLCRLVK
jgi:methionine-S-sulfoxide reductase